MNLRTKIALTYVVLATLGVVLTSVLTSILVTDYLDRRASENLRSQVELIGRLFDGGSLTVDPAGGQDAYLSSLARTLGIRLTVLSADGGVAFDSEVLRDSLTQMENHLTRPEVRAARRPGSVGVDKRRSASIGADYLYAARQIRGAGAGVLEGGYIRAAMSVEHIDRIDTDIRRLVWAIGLFIIGLILAVSYGLARRITGPLQKVIDTAQAITAGEYQQRVPIVGKDEIGRLAGAVNGMAEKLASDIEKLRKLERIRSEFLANVSHELRTPIFSLQGFLETLIDGAVDDPNVNRDFLEKAHHHATRLNSLLSDLIEIARIESGEMKMSFRYLPVGDFLRQIVEEMKPQADKEGISLTLDLSVPDAETVYGDRDRLKQVMINLIDNALKYTERGGAIDVRVAPSRDQVAIQVRDTGVGIAPVHHNRIFERFYRVDRDRSREVGGTGLGLAIVKHIVEAHGGTIGLASEPGKGSTFTFTLKR